jgi:glycolate oxidase FAD binding subunit
MRLGPLVAPRLWRLSVPQASAIDGLEGRWLMNWAGAERWLVSEAPPTRIRAAARAAGGHAALFRGAVDGEEIFEPLEPNLFALHQRLAAALDPAGVLNPGRMYAEL